MIKTRHLEIRQQQRGIPDEIVNLLLDYGSRVHDGKGGVICFFDKRSRQQMQRELGEELIRRIDKRLDSYCVLAGGLVITAGHRQQRILRDLDRRRQSGRGVPKGRRMRRTA